MKKITIFLMMTFCVASGFAQSYGNHTTGRFTNLNGYLFANGTSNITASTDTIGIDTLRLNIISSRGSGYITTLVDSLLISGNITVNGTGYIRWPRGTTAQRPSTPIGGEARYNISTEKFEGYENGSWKNFITASASLNQNEIAYADASGDLVGSGTFTFNGGLLTVGNISLASIRTITGLSGSSVSLTSGTSGDTDIRSGTSGDIIFRGGTILRSQMNGLTGTWDYQDNDLLNIDSINADTVVTQSLFTPQITNSSGDITLTPNASNHVNISSGGLEIGGTEAISASRAGSFTAGTFTGKIFARSGTSNSLELRAADLVGDNYIRFVDSSDGEKGYFGYGSTSTDAFQIYNGENADIEIYTNALYRGGISNDGSWTTNGGSFTAGDITADSVFASNIPLDFETTLTASQINNSGTTPITLIPAPGAGNYIVVLRVEFSIDFNTTAYTLGTTGPEIRYSGGNLAANDVTFIRNVLTATADAAAGSNGTESILYGINEAVRFDSNGDDHSLGDSSGKIHIWYVIRSI